MTDNSMDFDNIFRGEHNNSPNEFDVLCGKDYRNHPGNKLFRELVEQRCKEYQDASRRDVKASITVQIIDEISKRGGHFLTQTSNDDDDNSNSMSNEWLIADDKTVREKVSHALRSAKDPNRQVIRKKRKTVEKAELSDKENVLLATLERKRRAIFETLVAEFKESGGSSYQECQCFENFDKRWATWG